MIQPYQNGDPNGEFHDVRLTLVPGALQAHLQTRHAVVNATSSNLAGWEYRIG
jgi:hypothetical protein